MLKVLYGSADEPMARVLKMARVLFWALGKTFLARGIYRCHQFILYILPEQPLMYCEE